MHLVADRAGLGLIQPGTEEGKLRAKAIIRRHVLQLTADYSSNAGPKGSWRRFAAIAAVHRHLTLVAETTKGNGFVRRAPKVRGGLANV
jgi:hypothetical protein